jgi:hypothetical protein
MRLATCWNRRDGVARELERPTLTPERRAYLVTRHRQLCDEQDVLEAQMTRLAEHVEAES